MGRPRKTDPYEIMVATESFTVDLDGVPCHVKRGVTRAERGHFIVTVAPDRWEPMWAHYRVPRVEQATAAPGELRGE